jgi:alkylation response protein AidB-like acyl-CoA dehydrogenase
MWQYRAPLRDLRYVIEELLDLPAQWAALPAFAELDAATARQVLDEAARFATEVVAPLNASGDLAGCRWHDGQVTTPNGFPAAYRAFVDGGWPALSADPEEGGQGLPQVLDAALYEMLAGANHAWTMYPGLLHGACECLRAHASPALKAAYLDKLVSGEWLSTMCLTEAQAGSDLGLITTRAEPQADGSAHADGRVLLRGTKIFISGGEHDLSENIVHLVLARLPDAPAGSKGLTLFLCPKILPDGSRNAVRCDGIEKKMGIKASATCVLGFDGALAWPVGAPNRGLAAMFVMMNSARLHVALQGLGHAHAAHDNALRYAAERLQSRAPQRPEGARAPADPIVAHPAVRQVLLRQRVLVEGARVLAIESAHRLDLAAHAPEAAARARAEDELSLLTPVLKAFLTRQGFAIANDALQLHGGHGYVHDHGIEQCVRDSRIALIYEGTNEIQAIDLVLRKLVADGGVRFATLLDTLAAALPAQGRLADEVRARLVQLRTAANDMVEAAPTDAELPYRAADAFLDAAGWLLIAHAWARAEALSSQPRHGDDPWHTTKRASARHCADHLLPEFDHALVRVQAARHPLAPIEPSATP